MQNSFGKTKNAKKGIRYMSRSLKNKGPIYAVSAWSVYMYVHQYEYAPPPSTVPTTPDPIHTRNMHSNNCSKT